MDTITEAWAAFDAAREALTEATALREKARKDMLYTPAAQRGFSAHHRRDSATAAQDRREYEEAQARFQAADARVREVETAVKAAAFRAVNAQMQAAGLAPYTSVAEYEDACARQRIAHAEWIKANGAKPPKPSPVPWRAPKAPRTRRPRVDEVRKAKALAALDTAFVRYLSGEDGGALTFKVVGGGRLTVRLPAIPPETSRKNPFTTAFDAKRRLIVESERRDTAKRLRVTFASEPIETME